MLRHTHTQHPITYRRLPPGSLWLADSSWCRRLGLSQRNRLVCWREMRTWLVGEGWNIQIRPFGFRCICVESCFKNTKKKHTHRVKLWVRFTFVSDPLRSSNNICLFLLFNSFFLFLCIFLGKKSPEEEKTGGQVTFFFFFSFFLSSSFLSFYFILSCPLSPSSSPSC